jgi:hypothetical protein
MVYLVRPDESPKREHLSSSAQRYLEAHFAVHPAGLTVNGQFLRWRDIDAVEVVQAARQRTLAGWFVRTVLYQEERYHVGIYFGHAENVLTNVPLDVAKFVVASIAYNMQTPIRYTGIADIVALEPGE